MERACGTSMWDKHVFKNIHVYIGGHMPSMERRDIDLILVFQSIQVILPLIT